MESDDRSPEPRDKKNEPGFQEPPENPKDSRSAPLEVGASCTLGVYGLDCADCADTLKKAVKSIPGVKEADVKFAAGEMSLDYESEKALLAVKNTVENMGYKIQEDAGRQVATLVIPEMDCPEEVKEIKEALGDADGIVDMEFYPVDREAKFVFNSELTSVGEIIKKIEKLGVSARIKTKKEESLPDSMYKRYLGTTVISGVFVLVAYLMTLFPKTEFLTIPFFIAAIISGGWYISRRAATSLKNLNLDMNVLMSIAVLGAVLIGKWSEAAVVVFLFSLAQLLEYRTMEKARSAVRELMDITPDTAEVIRDGDAVVVPSDQVKVGEVIRIRPGTRIPLDGVVVEGESYVNQAPITGESIPVAKKPGEDVFAGTINQKGGLQVRVTHPARDTTIARVVRMVREAQARRAPAQAFVDKFAAYYTPVMVFAAILVATVPVIFFGYGLQAMIYRALVLLLIACPCALVISTPVSIVSALTTAAREGVLIKAGIHLENFASIDTLTIDKTGTLTRGELEVQKIVPLNGKTVNQTLAAAAAVERFSEHPIARAVVKKAETEQVEIPEAEGFQSITGMGARAFIGDTGYYVGSHRYFCIENRCETEAHDKIISMEKEGNTIVVVGDTNQLLGIISIADKLRPSAVSTIEKIKKEGIDRIVMLTGDNWETAKAIAKEVGIDFKAELLPGDKVEVVERLKKEGRKVSMVGDGVNDAPALAASTVAVAMGTAGTDTALEVADIALMADDLSRIPPTLKLAKKSLAIIKQNIALSIIIKAVFLILAFLGIATLWMAVFADMGASLIVILNGIRLLKFKY